MNDKENRILDITTWRDGIEDTFLFESDLVELPTFSQLKLKGILGMLGASGFTGVSYSISTPIPVLLSKAWGYGRREPAVTLPMDGPIGEEFMG